VTNVDAHNGVDVDIEGVSTHFNVSQINRAHGSLVDRPPPAYQEDSLVYEVVDQKAADSKAGPREAERKLERPNTRSKPSASESAGGAKTQPKPSAIKSAREDRAPKAERIFQMVRDTQDDKRYAAEIVSIDGTPSIQLYLGAKGGKYHKIWYNPNDADTTKTQASKPGPTWKQWTVPLDNTFDLLGQPCSNMKSLDRKLLKKTVTFANAAVFVTPRA
jgi:hypothetical protein